MAVASVTVMVTVMAMMVNHRFLVGLYGTPVIDGLIQICPAFVYVCVSDRERERESESIGFGVTVCGKSRVEKYERERGGKKVGVIVFEKRKRKIKMKYRKIMGFFLFCLSLNHSKDEGQKFFFN